MDSNKNKHLVNFLLLLPFPLQGEMSAGQRGSGGQGLKKQNKQNKTMKKLLTILTLIPLLSCSQVTPVQTFKIANNTTPIGVNLPSGTFIFDMNTLRPYQLKLPADASQTLSDNIAVQLISDTGIVILDSTLIVGGYFWQTGTGNSVFIGENAGIADDATNNKNVFIGYYSGYLNTSGAHNVALGSQSLFNNISGTSNTAIGNSALTDNDIGINNTAIGSSSLYQNTEGNYNTAVGANALMANSIGVNNTALGYRAMYSNIYSNNTAIGYQSGINNINGSANVFLGYQSGYNEAGSNKLYISNSNTASPLIYGEFDNNLLTINGLTTIDSNLIVNGRFWQTGIGNSVLIGIDAGLNDDLTVNANVFIGYKSGYNTTSGYNNIAIGKNAMYNSNTNNVIAIGENAALSASGAGASIAIGPNSLKVAGTAGGIHNTAIGSSALVANSGGSFNVALGMTAGYNVTYGSYNIMMGNESLFAITTGQKNIAIGHKAGYSTTGNENIFIGHTAGYYETGSDKLYIDNSNTTTPLIYGDFNDDQITINGDFTVTGQYNISSLNTAPTSSTATGTLGEIRITSDYIYICTATNTWVRTQLTSF